MCPPHRFPTIRLSGLFLVAGLAGCSVAPEGVGIHDPYESFNREIHAFNKGLDSAFFGEDLDEDFSIPPEIAIPVSNFADNVALPGKVLNSLLQGDIEAAASNTFRFILNTVVGLGGLADPARIIGLPEYDTDFGQTLAIWGVPEGAYLELPLLGPSTERDAFGMVVDSILDPLDRVGTGAQRDFGPYARLAEQVIDRSDYAATVSSVLYESADSYAQTRLIYLQNRQFELARTTGDDNIGSFVDPFEDLE